MLDLLLAAGVPEASMPPVPRSPARTVNAAPSTRRRRRSSLPRRASRGRPAAAPLLDPAALLDGGGTLYLCAPAHDQRRLMPAFRRGGRPAVEHAYECVARTRRPLDPPLLVVLDEAANIAPLADLDGLAATAAGHGVQLVTVWHDLAQITARYGARATTVVNNHRAKLFLLGHLRSADPRLRQPSHRRGGGVAAGDHLRWDERADHHPLAVHPAAGHAGRRAHDQARSGAPRLRRAPAGPARPAPLDGGPWLRPSASGGDTGTAPPHGDPPPVEWPADGNVRPWRPAATRDSTT